MEMERLIELWKRARARGEDAYLATVVHVEGSSYRKPGARMLVTSGGERAGTISGGCLEAEVSRKIAWHTRNGAHVQMYKSSFDDDNEGVPYGLGCGGTIWILMESGEAVDAVMQSLELALEQRIPSVTVSWLIGKPSTLAFAADALSPSVLSGEMPLEPMSEALRQRRPVAAPVDHDADLPQYICLPVLPPPRLHVFGAGDDVQPIVRFAADLGWDVTVADGRSHLLHQERFPQARRLHLLGYTSPASPDQQRELVTDVPVEAGDCAVILTHSYEQDRALLKALLPRPLQYLGILGPLHRTKRLIEGICEEIGLTEEACLARLHAPVGLPIGSGDPAAIALSIVAEIQAHIAGVRVQVDRI